MHHRGQPGLLAELSHAGAHDAGSVLQCGAPVKVSGENPGLFECLAKAPLWSTHSLDPAHTVENMPGCFLFLA